MRSLVEFDPDIPKLLEEVEEAADVEKAIYLIRDGFGLANVTYHFAASGHGAWDAPFVRTTYPELWVARYLMKGYFTIDPVLQHGFERLLPFEWCDIELDGAAAAMMEDASAHQISLDGYSIPVIDHGGRRAVFSVNAAEPGQSWKDLLSKSRTIWAEIAHLVHRKAIFEVYRQPNLVLRLSPREVECLQWAALGKDHRTIALILGISEHTTRGYLKSARFKLGSATVASAVARAIKLRLIAA